MGMLSACLNGAVVGYLLSRGESEITGVKVCPFLPLSAENRVEVYQKYLEMFAKQIYVRPLFVRAEIMFLTFREWLNEILSAFCLRWDVSQSFTSDCDFLRPDSILRSYPGTY
jgi:hypothetical protein